MKTVDFDKSKCFQKSVFEYAIRIFVVYLESITLVMTPEEYPLLMWFFQY